MHSESNALGDAVLVWLQGFALAGDRIPVFRIAGVADVHRDMTGGAVHTRVWGCHLQCTSSREVNIFRPGHSVPPDIFVLALLGLLCENPT